MNKIIIGLVVGYIVGFLMAFYVTNDKMAREQARSNVLEMELYNERHKEPEEVRHFIGEHIITFYNLNKNKTATGTIPKHNHTVACDFNKIPKNSYIYIEGYGKRKCEDTGVYGKKIDIYMARPTKELLQMGKQKKNVYILTEK